MFHAIDKIFRCFGTKREAGHIVYTIATHIWANWRFQALKMAAPWTIFANV
jgi:hypothetical protein